MTDLWAERFLIDPKDPLIGPLRSDIDVPHRRMFNILGSDDDPVFSSQGLEGVWIPYGGGYSACLGRLFARKLILYLSALIASCYNVEVLSDIMEMDTKKFGLGGQFPKGGAPFRTRKRA